jgi:SPP1 family predicted phage head-tail adaptor
MRELRAGSLDRRIQLRRAAVTLGDFGSIEAWADHGGAIWAAYAPVRDSEKYAAGQVSATTMARFTVRWSAFTADITAKDRLAFDGREFNITGTKEIGRREFVEISAVAESD